MAEISRLAQVSATAGVIQGLDISASDLDVNSLWVGGTSGSGAAQLTKVLVQNLSAATNLNTASAIVKRDSSGNFVAGTITASLTGHASLDLLASNNLSDVSSTATAFANISPLTTAGDLIYENSTPAPARLPIGTSGQVLTVVSGLPAWATATTGANTALSNLSAVAINTSLLPGSDNSINLGSSSFSWAAANIHQLKDGSAALSVDVYNRLLSDSSSATQLSWSTSGVTVTGASTSGGMVYAASSGVLTQDATNLFYDATSKRLGIGNNAPLASIHVATSAAATALHGIVSENNSANTGSGAFFGRKSRGTFASPTAISSGDGIAVLAGQGYGATAYSGNAVFIKMAASQAFTDTAQGTEIQFGTTANGSAASASRVVAKFTNDVGFQLLDTAAANSLTQYYTAGGTSYSIKWPASQASGTQVLQNDGAGNLSWATSTTGANTSLSNLSAVAINTSLLPGADNSINLGSSSFSWASANIHALDDSAGVVSVDVYNRVLKDSSAATQLTWSTSGVEINANPLNMNSNKVTNLAAGSTSTDGVNYGQVILASGANAFTAAQSLGGFNLTNVADPVNPQDAATKNYTDNLAHGLSWKQVVRAASTANLNLASMPASVDGVTLNSGDRFLAKDQSTTSQNGIYIFNGAASAATRSSDANTAAELTWATVEVGADSATQAGYIFRESADITTIGTDPVTFVIISHGLDWTFNNGLSVTGNQVNVAPGDSSLTATAGSLVVHLNAAGALVTSSGLSVNLATSNPGLQISSNQLDVKYNPAGAIVASSSGIAWNPDGSSLEISSNAARIKTTAYDQVTITGGGGSAAAVQQSPSVKRTLVAGQSFSANTSYAVRWGLTANGETANRVYAADITTSSFNLYYVIGMASSGTVVSAGQNISVTTLGSFNLSSSDTAFGSNTDGAPVFLTASGTFSTTAPSTAGQAITRIGIVQLRSATAASNIIDVMPQFVTIN